MTFDIDIAPKRVGWVRLRNSLAACAVLLSAPGFVAGPATGQDAPVAETAAPARPAASDYAFSLDELLSFGDVTHMRTNAAGDVAWVERQDGGWNVAVARAPAYEPKQLTQYREDDGRELFLVGFAAGGDVLFRRGAWGRNFAHASFPPPVQLLAANENAKAPRVVVEDVSEKWTAAPAVSADGASVIAAAGGDVLSYSLRRGQSPRKLFSVRGVIKSLVPSPDGRRLAFVTDRANLKRGKYAFVGVYDMDKKTIAYMAPGLGTDQSVVWSPDGARLAFIRFGYEPRTWRFSNHREGAPFSIVVADAATGEGAPVFTSEIGYGSRFNGFAASGYSGLGGSGNLLWLADGQLVFPYEKTGWKLLYAVSADAQAGGGAARLLTPGDFEVAGAAASPDRAHVFYWANTPDDLARLRLFRLDLANGLAPQRVDLGDGADMVSGAHVTPVIPLSKDRFAGLLVGERTPKQLTIHDGGNAPKKLNSGPTAPRADKMPAPEIVSYSSLDGKTISAVLYRPLQPLRTGANPAIVWAHGGSRDQVYPTWETTHSRDAGWFYLLSRGYYVMLPNYRSGTGYGLDFRETPSYGGRGAGDVQDFVAAARYLGKEIEGVDADRIGIVGVSYGGHLVTNALARSDVFAAGVSFAGVGDWVVEMEKDFAEILQFNIPERMKLEKLAHESSAIHKIDEWGDEPILFVHGDHDGSAAMQQSLELYLALQRRGKTAEALVYPGEAHQLKRTDHIREYVETMEDFLARYVAK